MRKILSIIGIYLLSFIYFVMILFLSHLTNTYALRTTITPFDLINSLTGLLFFPVSLIWFRALIRNTRDNPGATNESALNRGVDSSAYFLAVQTSNATVLIPGGYDSIIFKILLLFCIDLTLYIFSLPLLILMILSKIFNWHLFETIILAFESHRYRKEMKPSKLISPVDLQKLTALIQESQFKLIFIGSPRDRLSRLIVPKLKYALKLNSIQAYYFDFTDADPDDYQSLFNRIGITALPSLTITNGDGSVTSIDLDHLEKAIQFWSQKRTR